MDANCLLKDQRISAFFISVHQRLFMRVLLCVFVVFVVRPIHISPAKTTARRGGGTARTAGLRSFPRGSSRALRARGATSRFRSARGPSAGRRRAAGRDGGNKSAARRARPTPSRAPPAARANTTAARAPACRLARVSSSTSLSLALPRRDASSRLPARFVSAALAPSTSDSSRYASSGCASLTSRHRTTASRPSRPASRSTSAASCREPSERALLVEQRALPLDQRRVPQHAHLDRLGRPGSRRRSSCSSAISSKCRALAVGWNRPNSKLRGRRPLALKPARHGQRPGVAAPPAATPAARAAARSTMRIASPCVSGCSNACSTANSSGGSTAGSPPAPRPVNWSIRASSSGPNRDRNCSRGRASTSPTHARPKCASVSSSSSGNRSAAKGRACTRVAAALSRSADRGQPRSPGRRVSLTPPGRARALAAWRPSSLRTRRQRCRVEPADRQAARARAPASLDAALAFAAVQRREVRRSNSSVSGASPSSSPTQGLNRWHH